MTLFCIMIPSIASALLLHFKEKKIIKQLGTVAWAYLLGICFSLIMHFVSGAAYVYASNSLEILAYLSVALGIPFILFSNSTQNLKNIPGKAKKAFGLLILSVLITTSVFYFLYTKKLENGDILSGMAFAIYTGGTPNLNAVSYIFNLDSRTLLAANLSDVIIGGIFYLFIIAISRYYIKRNGIDAELDVLEHDSQKKSSKTGALISFCLSLSIVVVSAGIGVCLCNIIEGDADTLSDYLVPAIMIGSSIGGIIFSKNEKVNCVKENEEFGQFFITLFSFTIASLIDVNTIRNINNGVFFVFLTITVVTFFVHMLLCKISGIDFSTAIVTSTAGIYGPAFVPGVCDALEAKKMISVGLILGSFGYAIGTFLGCGLVLILQYFVR